MAGQLTRFRLQPRSVLGKFDVILALMSPEVYRLLVGDRKWKPERYQQWIADALTQQLTTTGE